MKGVVIILPLLAVDGYVPDRQIVFLSAIHADISPNKYVVRPCLSEVVDSSWSRLISFSLLQVSVQK